MTAECEGCQELARSGWYHWFRQYQGMTHDEARKALAKLGLL